jgi:zinc protease
MDIPYTKHSLPNGLDVLVHTDRHLPMVAVSVWYHVGSKNERPGRTGFAHLFEHLMFEGSAHHPHGYFPPLQRAGALLNGSTNPDRTNYWEVVPTGALDLALWMESDRMGHLLPAITQERFENQRDVVLNERRQNYENRPYGMAGIAISAALFAPDHPYHWLTIGSPDDLKASTLDEVHAFFRRYYHPGNASVALAGDIDDAEGVALVERYFGEIAAGEPVGPVPHAPAALATSRRIVYQDRVQLPRLYLAWHSPKMFEPGDAELDLAADLLTHGKTSRLYKALVYESRIAVDVSAYQGSRELSGVFQITATAAPGHALGEIEAVIARTLGELAEAGPTPPELARSLAQTEAHFVYRVQSIGGFGGKADQLNAYNVLAGDPGFLAADRARYESATAEGVAQAVGRWLAGRPCVALSVVPHDGAALALAGSEPVEVA